MNALKEYLQATADGLEAGGLETFDVPRPHASQFPIICAAFDYSVSGDAPGARDYYIALCGARDALEAYADANGYSRAAYYGGHTVFLEFWRESGI